MQQENKIGKKGKWDDLCFMPEMPQETFRCLPGCPVIFSSNWSPHPSPDLFPFPLPAYLVFYLCFHLVLWTGHLKTCSSPLGFLFFCVFGWREDTGTRKETTGSWDPRIRPRLAGHLDVSAHSSHSCCLGGQPPYVPPVRPLSLGQGPGAPLA